MLVDQGIAHDAEQAQVVSELGLGGDPLEQGDASGGRRIVEGLAQRGFGDLRFRLECQPDRGGTRTWGSLSPRPRSIAS